MTEVMSELKRPKILVVDDDEEIRTALQEILEHHEFRVTAAASVSQALHCIDTKSFDVLLSDLHMPGAGDGFTVVSAMRHSHPSAVTLMLTGYPAIEEAMSTIRLQADGILIKPLSPNALVAQIRAKLENPGARDVMPIERVAAILERDTAATIDEWLNRVNVEVELTCVPLSQKQRMGHLPKLFEELVHRLRVPRVLGNKQASEAAVQHGKVRQAQGYSIPMIVEESRILQVSIFHTLQRNLNVVDFSLLLGDVMTIADEVDSQLKQTLTSFMAQSAESGASTKQ